MNEDEIIMSLLGKIFESKSHVAKKIEMSLLHALQNLEKARLEREIDQLNRIRKK
jgi:hypothetical protein